MSYTILRESWTLTYFTAVELLFLFLSPFQNKIYILVHLED